MLWRVRGWRRVAQPSPPSPASLRTGRRVGLDRKHGPENVEEFECLIAGEPGLLAKMARRWWDSRRCNLSR